MCIAPVRTFYLLCIRTRTWEKGEEEEGQTSTVWILAKAGIVEVI